METYRNTVSTVRSRGQVSRGAETARTASAAVRIAQPARAAATGAPSSRTVPATRGRARARSNFMRYAADSRVVQTMYSFITGPTRFVFYGLVALAIGIGVYFPVRDLYAAYRTGDILERQLEIRTTYNENLASEVELLLSKEGIELVARERFGLVMPGEYAVDVVGADDYETDTDDEADADDSSSTSDDAEADEASDDASGDDTADSSDDSSASTDQDGSDGSSESDDSSASETSTADADTLMTVDEVETAEAEAAAEAPWYIKVLDFIFFYDGVEGQTVVSSGE